MVVAANKALPPGNTACTADCDGDGTALVEAPKSANLPRNPSVSRRNESARRPAAITFEAFHLDLRGGRLLCRGEPIALRPKTWAVLQHLAGRPGELITRDELMDAIWPDVAVTETVLSKSISELRMALGDSLKAPRIIETVQRRGFRFIPQTELRDSRSPVSGFGEEPGTEDQGPGTAVFVGRSQQLHRLASVFAKAYIPVTSQPP